MNLYQPTITGSLSVSGSVNISGSITIAGGGTISGTASIATTALTASSADNLLVRNTLTAQTLVVQTITSSVDFVTGSTRFGSVIGNTHVFTGSIFTSGSVNIGTSSSMSGVALNILSTPNAAGIVINNSSSAAYTGLRIYNDQASANRALEIDYAGSTYGGALVSSGIAGESAVITTTGAYPLQFGTGNTYRMALLANGNLAIGSLTASLKLTVQADTTDMISWRSPTYEVGRLGLDTNNAHGAIFLYSSGSQTIQISAKPGADTYFNAGNVGIGTNTPGSILHVKGGSAGGANFGAELRVWENTFGAVLQGSTVANTQAFLGNFRYNFVSPSSSVTNYLAAGHGILFYDGIHIFSSNPGGSSGGTFTPSERLTITNGGILTVPSQVSFKAYLSANINPSKGTNITVPYNIEEYDTQGNFSTSTYKFTAPVAGKYLFTVNFNAYSLDDTAYLRVSLLLNASTVRTLFLFQNMPTGNTGDVNVSGADILNLSAGNTVEVRVNTDGSGTFGMSQNLDWNSFSGHLLG
jgi:hypothetical protein